MNKETKAVVLGTNDFLGLSIIRCLGREGIPVVAVDYDESDAFPLKSKYVSETLIGPYYKDRPEELKDFLIDYGKKQELKPVLIPNSDVYAAFTDTYLDELKEFYLINMTEQGLWTDLIDKDTFYQLADKHNVRYPKTFSADRDDILESVESEIGYPCLLKPVNSKPFVAKFGIKLFKVHNLAELKERLKVTNEANIDMVIQQLIEGFDNQMYMFDAYLDQDSKVTHWMTAQKQRQYPINYGASVYAVQKYVPELYDIGARFLEEVGYKGFGELEFKKDSKTGEFYVIEMNARMTSFNAMIDRVGLNMPLITYLELTGQPIGSKAIEEDTGEAFKNLFQDKVASRHYMKAKQLTLGEVMKKHHKNVTGSVWANDDLRPNFIFFKDRVMKTMLRRWFKR